MGEGEGVGWCMCTYVGSVQTTGSPCIDITNKAVVWEDNL